MVLLLQEVSYQKVLCTLGHIVSARHELLSVNSFNMRRRVQYLWAPDDVTVHTLLQAP